MPLTKCTKEGKDGWKWGDSGICFIGPDARERATAVGRAIQAQDSGFIIDSSNPIKAKIDDDTGFLTAPVTLSRIGVQYYQGFELGLTDRLMDKIGVFRSPEEVFSQESIDSFTNLVVTDDHPDAPVTIENVKDLQIGTVSHVKRDGDFLKGILTITDKDEIKKIQDGKKEVSVGYGQELIPQTGKDKNGDAFEFAQTEIKANHLAIVDAGRCGAACRLTLDEKEKDMKTLTIDGINYDVENEQLAQAISKQQKTFDAEKEAMSKKLKKEEEEKDEAVKAKDAAEAKFDALSKDQLTDDALNALVQERGQLISDASAILGDEMPECGNCPKEIKAAVVDKVLPDMTLDGKSDDYINAAYDMALVKHKKAKDSADNLSKDFKDKDKNQVTRDTAQQEYENKILGIKEG